MHATEPTAGAPTAALDPRRERLAILGLALVAFALNLNTNLLGALQPFLPSAVSPDQDAFGWHVSAAAVGSAIGALLAGPLIGRSGLRAPLLGGLLLFVVASALHWFAAGFAALAALRALSGLAVGVAYACASAQVAELVPYQRRGKAMGAFTAGMFLAIPVGLPVAVMLANGGQWRVAFLVQAGFATFGLICAAAVLPRGAAREVWRWRDPLRVLRRGPALAALLATMLHVGSFFTTVQLATAWLDATGLVAKADQGALWVGLGLAAAIGSFALGRLGDRFGKQDFVLLTSIVLVGCFGLLSVTGNGWLVLLAGGLLAVTAAARTGPLQALASGLVEPRDLGTLMGLRACLMQAGVAVFARLAQLVQDGDPRTFTSVLYLAAGCQALSYLAIRFGVREPE